MVSIAADRSVSLDKIFPKKVALSPSPYFEFNSASYKPITSSIDFSSETESITLEFSKSISGSLS